ncbi:MAG: LysR family transcriptional regulator [Eubacteriales bacterium]|nr:LysR family transcriptional regulator [Eubacteriales bacterium]
MNLMHLRYFCKLAEIENYTVAAAELYISQPGLSGAIISIEKELGLKLFEKSGRNIKLTKYGSEFYKYINEALRVLDKGVSVMHEYSGKLTGKIEIGAIPTIQTTFLPEVLADFKERCENIEIKVYEGHTKQIVENLQESLYDVGFCSYDVNNAELEAIPVLNQKVVAIMHKDHPLAEQTSLTFEDILKYRIYTYSMSQLIGKQFRDLLAEQKLEVNWKNIHFDYPNELLIAGILSHGSPKKDSNQTIGLIANVPYLENFNDLSIIPIEDVPENFRKVYMVYNKNKFRTHAIDLFMDFVKTNYSLEQE